MNRISEKLTLYKTLYTLNQGLEIILLACTRLEELGVFGPDHLRSCRIMTEELRARANHEVTEALRIREEDDALRFQNLRFEWEARLKAQGEPQSERPKPRRTTQGRKAVRR
jgi:hypothetical protein